MIDVLEDMDSILKTGSKYLLGKWISDARSWGLTEMVNRLGWMKNIFHFMKQRISLILYPNL